MSCLLNLNNTAVENSYWKNLLKESLSYFSHCSDQISGKSEFWEKGFIWLVVWSTPFHHAGEVMVAGRSTVVGVVWLLVYISADQNSQSRRGPWYCGRDSTTISKTIWRTTPLRESQVFWDLKVSLCFLLLNGAILSCEPLIGSM